MDEIIRHHQAAVHHLATLFVNNDSGDALRRAIMAQKEVDQLVEAIREIRKN
jgi:hypothetical protein